MGVNQNNASNNMEKLASGLRINKAADDSAGLAISEKMRGQIRGLDQASRNAQDGISMIQTAEGSLGETHEILQRMRELATQAANDTNVGVDRNEIQKEMNSLTSEINRIGNTTEFNTQKLLNGGVQTVGKVDATSTAVVAGATGTQGFVDFDITTALADGETLVVGGETVTTYLDAAALTTAGDAFGILATDTADNQAAAIRGMTFSGLTATGTGANIILTQDTAGTGTVDTVAGTGAAKTTENAQVAGVADGADTAGSTQLTITTALADGETLAVGGETVTTYADATALAAANAGAGDALGILATQTADEQAAAIRGMSFTGLSETGGTGADVILTQTVAGTGDIAAATVTTPGATGSFSANFQIGANSGQSLTLNVADMRSVALQVSGDTSEGTVTAKNDSVASYVATANVTDGTDNTDTEFALDVSSHDKASAAISVINDAIESVSAERSNLGATQNRLEHTISNLGTSAENLQAAESRVRDVDMAREIMEMTKNNILSQASQAMLAQANQAPQSVLQLLG